MPAISARHLGFKRALSRASIENSGTFLGIQTDRHRESRRKTSFSRLCNAPYRGGADDTGASSRDGSPWQPL